MTAYLEGRSKILIGSDAGAGGSGGFTGIIYIAAWVPSTPIAVTGTVNFASLATTYKRVLIDTDSFANGSGGVLIPTSLAGQYECSLEVTDETASGWTIWDGSDYASLFQNYNPLNTATSGSTVVTGSAGATFTVSTTGSNLHFIKWTMRYLGPNPASYTGPFP